MKVKCRGFWAWYHDKIVGSNICFCNKSGDICCEVVLFPFVLLILYHVIVIGLVVKVISNVL